MTNQHYALAPVEGLHLTCDFVVYSAALFGCPPGYSPTPVRSHDAFREPHDILGGIPFRNYEELAEECSMDSLTIQSLQGVAAQKMTDFTCIAWEIEQSLLPDLGKEDLEQTGRVLNCIVETGEQIMDLIRLFLFKPGEDASIGKVGGFGGGVSGIWFGDGAGTRADFIARKTARFQLLQDPMERGISDVRKIYNDPVFRELSSVVCAPKELDPILSLVLRALRAFRETRDIPIPEARFKHLVAIAEDLARKNGEKRLQGIDLRNRIATMADASWNKTNDLFAATKDLWDNVRNPLIHSAKTFPMIGRDSGHAIPALERIVINMIQSVVLDWRDHEFLANA
jgi:hypothetical protein